MGDGGRQLLVCLRGTVGLEDPRLALDDLAQCPQADPLPVGQAPPLMPCRRVAVPRGGLEQLEHKPALADARHAHERAELRGAFVSHAPQHRDEDPELVPSSRERCPRLADDVYTPA